MIVCFLSMFSLEPIGSNFDCRLSAGPIPQVPPPLRDKHNKYAAYRSTLPIWNFKDEILEKIVKNPVILIRGGIFFYHQHFLSYIFARALIKSFAFIDTGCGKTTQVPQFILENAYELSKPVRIICTVPRRIAAISICDRVATERNDRVGKLVGYQIRLESCISSKETLLTYCTSGVLLRSLACPDYSILKNTTHIILDEVHERDRQTDFLLACLRDLLGFFPNLRLILMGADLDREIFAPYFGGPVKCPLIDVIGKPYAVKIKFLEDILRDLNYENLEMKSDVPTWRGKDKKHNSNDIVIDRIVTKMLNAESNAATIQSSVANPDADNMIKTVWANGCEETVKDFIVLVTKGEISIDYAHSETNVTMLMATAVQNMAPYVSILLSLGANLNVKGQLADTDVSYGAIEWAEDHESLEALEILRAHAESLSQKASMDDKPVIPENSENDEKILQRYLKSVADDRVDLMLIMRVIYSIHSESNSKDAILVFLPGYEDIVTLKNIVIGEERFSLPPNTYEVFTLHSNIQTVDQKAVFRTPREGVRKIVLATNIAESSLTIEDIVYVIDSGKVKEKSYDSLTGVSQLKPVWISKASANQRKGRAGRCRPGICFRLYSKARFDSMPEFTTPEILRSSCQELCLYARGLIQMDSKIADFFTKLPEPPAPVAVKKSVQSLISMGALDADENLTKLGRYLLDLPLEPSLGKALIYAVIFKCLDPILTIVSMVSHRYILTTV